MTTKAKTTKSTKPAKKDAEEEKELVLPPPPVEERTPIEDRSAYEDSWYRSLRALADRRHADGDEDVNVPED